MRGVDEGSRKRKEMEKDRDRDSRGRNYYKNMDRDWCLERSKTGSRHSNADMDIDEEKPRDRDAARDLVRDKDRDKKRDPDHPKTNGMGHNFFFAEQHVRLKTLNPGKDKEISKMIGDLWGNRIEEEKLVYQERELKNKKRYKSEMQETGEKRKTVCEN